MRCHCGSVGVKELGASTYCAEHVARLIPGWRGVGVRRVGGVGRPEFGPGMVDLECSWPGCRATWVGVVSEWCNYCRSAGMYGDPADEMAQAERMVRDLERARLLTMPSPDPLGVEPFDRILCRWGAELREAVTAHLLTLTEARDAWTKAVAHVAA